MDNKEILNYATGFVRPKTTSLFFDKIIIPKEIKYSEFGINNHYDKIPDEVCDYNITYRLTSGAFGMSNGRMQLEQLLETLGHKKTESAKNIMLKLCNAYNSERMHISWTRNQGILEIMKSLEVSHNVKVTPIYFNKTEFEKVVEEVRKKYRKISILKSPINNSIKYETSQKNLYEVLINEIPIPDERTIDWSQILQIRADKHAIDKLKRFRSWVELDLQNYNANQFTDILNQRLEDYKSSLKKHGIKFVVGGFTSILSSVGTILGAINSGELAIVGASCVVTAGTIQYTVDNFFSLNEVRKSPIAFYYDIIKRLN